MNRHYQAVIDFFGEDWFQNSWNNFLEKRNTYSQGSLDKNIVVLELDLHPLLKDLFKVQRSLDSAPLDFSLIDQSAVTKFEFISLGRDLVLLEREISQRGNLIKEALRDPVNYSSHRYNLFIASGYKLLGWKVTFIPEGSSKGKTADLLVQKGSEELLVECKQRNQREGDKKRFVVLAGLSEKFFEQIRSLGKKDLVIDIQAKGEIADLTQEILEKITRDLPSISSDPVINVSEKIEIRYTKTDHHLQMIKTIRESGHFSDKPVFTVANDNFFVSDPVSKSIVFLNKSVHQEEVPLNILERLDDANRKEKTGRRLVVYLDLGTGMEEWGDKLIKILSEDSNTPSPRFPNIDMTFITQVIPKILTSRQAVIKPDIKGTGRISKMGGNPRHLNLFGFQGETGIDQYLETLDLP